MAKSDDLVKYITQRVVTYIDTPADVRRQKREVRREQKRAVPWEARWFGMLPMALRLFWEQRPKREKADSLFYPNKERPQ